MHSNSCPGCGADSEFRAHGVIAPWLAELCQISNASTQLRRCGSCRLVFFSYRYSDAELTRLYSEYRGEKFYKLRHHWEPWYDESVNDAFSDNRSNDNQIHSRRSFTEAVLRDSGVDPASLNGCVDFGGDLGQFIPQGVSEPHFVVERGSALKGKNGSAKFVDTIGEVPEDVDLVLNCYVLEHLPELKDVMMQMRARLRTDGFIHFEIPLDKFNVSAAHRTEIYRKYLALLSRSRTIFMLMDFLTGVYRHFFRRVVWFGIVKQSEHINYFDKNSIVELLSRQGGKIMYVSSEDHGYRVGTVRQGRMACLVQ